MRRRETFLETPRPGLRGFPMLVLVTPRSGARAALDALREHGDSARVSKDACAALSRLDLTAEDEAEAVSLVLAAMMAREPLGLRNERAALRALEGVVLAQLARCRTTLEQDLATAHAPPDDPSVTHNSRNAAKALAAEKRWVR